MKKLVLLLVLLMAFFVSFSQTEKITEHYRYYRAYNYQKDEWSEIQTCAVYIVYHYNKYDDIKIIPKYGEATLLEKKGSFFKDVTEDGIEYVGAEFKDPQGRIVYVFLYEDGDTLLCFDGIIKIHYTNR